MSTIESGRVVTLSLTIADADSGKTLQRFSADDPTAYLHGYDNLVSALEQALTGKAVGEAFDLTAQDAYGPASKSEPAAVPKREFPRTWRLEKGTAFFANGSAGEPVKLFVHDVRGSRVYVSGDHPWAGLNIRFTGEILHLRNATDHEREHGHAHGPGGHAH
ncbi:MAG: peptidylprolyl isomerase [Myxococcota bacterium]